MCGGDAWAINKHHGFKTIVAIKTNGRKVIDIDEKSIEKILNIYRDEHHLERPVFTDALLSGELSYSDLRKESETLMIPWQLFFLSEDKVNDTISKIDDKRKAKFDIKLIASRDNSTGGGVSLRIADRLIALQEFATESVVATNAFCGVLKNLHRDKWTKCIIDYFEIDVSWLESGRKEKTLDKLIACLEEKNIRVARGVLDNKNMLLPVANRQVYRKSSGFVIKDDKVPYIFLPNELNDSETAGRQILTLFVLLILIGNDQYDLSLNGELELYIKGQKTLQQAFGVATEILLPFSETNSYEGLTITSSTISDLSSKYMLTPSAIIVTLGRRGLITNDTQKEQLLDDINAAASSGNIVIKRAANIDNAVKKLCGIATTTDIIKAIEARSLGSVRAQYLIFGRIDKLRFAKFKATVGL